MQKVPKPLPGEEGFYRTQYDSHLLPAARRGQGQWDFGDCTARAVLAWFSLREMIADQQIGIEVEKGQQDYLLSMLHPDTGLVFVPDRSDPDNGQYYYHIWDQGRTLRALVRWYELKPDERGGIGPLIEKMIAGLDRFATVKGIDPKWGPYSGWPGDEVLTDQSATPFGWVHMRSGLMLEPLAMYCELTDDPAALDLAKRFTSCVLGGHEGDAMLAEQKSHYTFGADGSFVGHTHTRTATLIGLTKLGSYLYRHGEPKLGKELIRKARLSYDWLFDSKTRNRASKIGWIPEHSSNAYYETCCGADMIELATALATCAEIDPEFSSWVDLSDDIEKMTVNMIVPTQIRMTPEFEAYLTNLYGDKASEYLPEARCFDGACPGLFLVNDFFWTTDGRVLMGCCCYYGTVRAFHSAWLNMVVGDADNMKINSLLPYDSDTVKITSELPRAGRAQIVIKKPVDVSLRIPGYAGAEDLQIRVNGKLLNSKQIIDPTGHYLLLGRCKKGTNISVQFDLQKKETITEEYIAGKNYTIKWRGNFIKAMTPPGPMLPLFPQE